MTVVYYAGAAVQSSNDLWLIFDLDGQAALSFAKTSGLCHARHSN